MASWPLVIVVASFVVVAARNYISRMLFGSEDDVEYDGEERTTIRHEGGI